MVDPVPSKSSDMTGEKGWFPQKKINEVLLEARIVDAGLARLRHLSTCSGWMASWSEDQRLDLCFP